MARIKPAFKYYGGKFYLSPWIIGMFVSHKLYVEPFGGAASVLLNKPRSDREIYSDLNSGIVCLLTMIRDQLPELTEELRKIKVSAEVYYAWKAKQPVGEMETAVRCFVLHRMSRSGTGTGFSKSVRQYRGMPENEAAWDTGITNLPIVSRRLQDVEIRCSDAFDLIQECDGPESLFYLDPPYVTKTRSIGVIYQIEMDESLHTRLSEIVHECKGKVIISGYESDLYNRLYSNWNKEFKDQYLHSSQEAKKVMRRECVWKNF